METKNTVEPFKTGLKFFGDVGLLITYNFQLRFFIPCTYHSVVIPILLIDGYFYVGATTMSVISPYLSEIKLFSHKMGFQFYPYP